MKFEDITTTEEMGVLLKKVGVAQVSLCAYVVHPVEPERKAFMIERVLYSRDWEFPPYYKESTAVFTLSELWHGIGLGTRMAEDIWNEIAASGIPSRMVSIPYVAQFIVDYLKKHPEEVKNFNERLLKPQA